jgi:hypothetical protein
LRCGCRKFVFIGGQGLTIIALLLEFAIIHPHLPRYLLGQTPFWVFHWSGHDRTHQTTRRFLGLDFQIPSGHSSRESGAAASALRLPAECQEVRVMKEGFAVKLGFFGFVGVYIDIHQQKKENGHGPINAADSTAAGRTSGGNG